MMEGTNVAFFLAENSGKPNFLYKAYNHPELDARV
jgi:hypothetical protein